MPDNQIQIVGERRTRANLGGAKAPGGQQASATSAQAPGHTQSATHLADACHDLRQPLQTLFLLQALLAKTVEGEAARKLVARVEIALAAMASVVDRLTVDAPSKSEAAASASGSQSADALAVSLPAAHAAKSAEFLTAPVVFVVDDDDDVRAALRSVLEDDGHEVRDFASCEAFLAHQKNSSSGCLLVDAYLPGMSGLELLQRLHTIEGAVVLPSIMITGQSDVSMAVNAMKAGAIDFIEKPIGRENLLTCIRRAVAQSQDQNARAIWQQEAEHLVAALTERQREIMALVLAGVASKNIAADLGISQRTVENHRAAIMAKTGAKSLPALARLAVRAAVGTTPNIPKLVGPAGLPAA
jgi:two-component system, chemotaxis family, CheB/CheR fusion protein